MARAARVLGWMVLAQLVLIAASGVYLYFNYRPTGPGVWPDLASSLHPAVRQAARVRDLHALQSTLLLASALAFTVVALVGPVRAWWDRAAAATHLVALAVASFSGLLLPWDQLALNAVTVGSSFKGFGSIVAGSNVRFVLVDGSEISTQTIVRWLGAHVVLSVVALAASSFVLIRGRQLRPALVQQPDALGAHAST
jgi:quinol-cytochrome oxidoreductase complex cytochrome b subunit